MEENQESSQLNQENPNVTPQVGFPVSQPKPSGGKINKWVIIFLGLLILGLGGVFFFTRKSKTETTATPTPETELNSPATPLPSPTPAPIDRTKVKIEVQNGTGITGEGAYLQDRLASLGYKNIKIGNASTQNNTSTVVTFSKDLDAAVVEEITSKLEEIYKSVDTKTSGTQTTNVLVVTGLRKGQTPAPSATPKASPTTSPTPTPTGL